MPALTIPRPATSTAALPKTSPWLWNWFTWYAGDYLRKRFHAVRLLKGHAPPQQVDGPLLIYLNHPSWYDPLVGLFCARRFFNDRTHYAPIDAAALAKYRLLERVGFYGIDLASRRGAAKFLQTSAAIAQRADSTQWLTPQGRFSDVRERPPGFKPGLAHLAERLPQLTLLPLALEYVFWNESRPEVLLAFGEPVAAAVVLDAQEWEERLSALQDTLAAAAMARSSQQFTTLLEGRSGVGGVYDLWRRAHAALRGRRFSASHEEPPR